MIKKIATNLDSSNASGPDCIPVVVLKNCEPEGVLFSRLLKTFIYKTLILQLTGTF